jgi:hypothetical protein
VIPCLSLQVYTFNANTDDGGQAVARKTRWFSRCHGLVFRCRMDRNRTTFWSSMHDILSLLLYEVNLVTRDVRVSPLPRVLFSDLHDVFIFAVEEDPHSFGDKPHLLSMLNIVGQVFQQYM